MEISRSTFRKLIALILIAVLSYLTLQNIGTLWYFVGDLLSLCMPILLGLVLAFIINVPMRGIERLLFEHPFYLPQERWYPLSVWRKKLKRPFSLLLALVLILGLFTAVLVFVIPSLVQTISDLLSGIPAFLHRIQTVLDRFFADNQQAQNLFREVQSSWQTLLNDVWVFAKHGAGSMLQNTFYATTSAFSSLGSFFISLILAIYILIAKETLQRQCLKVLHAFFSRAALAQILPVFSLMNRTYSSYISGQFIEACILGGLTLLGMLILNLPFAPMISVLVIVMAMIPIVGSFISAGVGFLLILTQNSTKALIFLLFFLILQQIEGNLIYPHVVGKSVKLPGLWVLVAITLGGSLAGVPGMLVSIPTFSVLYTLTGRWLNLRLAQQKKNQPVFSIRPWMRAGANNVVDESLQGTVQSGETCTCERQEENFDHPRPDVEGSLTSEVQSLSGMKQEE